MYPYTIAGVATGQHRLTKSKKTKMILSILKPKKTFQQRKKEVLSTPEELESAIDNMTRDQFMTMCVHIGALTEYGLSLTTGYTDTQCSAQALDELKDFAEFIEDVVETWIDTPENK